VSILEKSDGRRRVSFMRRLSVVLTCLLNRCRPSLMVLDHEALGGASGQCHRQTIRRDAERLAWNRVNYLAQQPGLFGALKID
jgi:hypothetical protein